jgi:hypothetical protein
MTQKAAKGGTIGKAPIGYLNVRTRDELGREIRTVELDPDRAGLVEWAFKAYASGEWTVSQLHDELTSRGLTSPATPKRPSKTLAVSSVHRMLTNSYYKGDVTYRGVLYKGSHTPLVPSEVWYQVQSVLMAHKTGLRGHAGARPLPEGHRLLRPVRLPAHRGQREEPLRERVPVLRVLGPARQAHRVHPSGDAHRRRSSASSRSTTSACRSPTPSARPWAA